MKTTLNIAFLAIVLLSNSVIYAQDALSILKEMDKVMYTAKDMTGTNKIVLIDKAGKQQIREATIIQKGNDKRLMRFTLPATQAGIAVLSLPADVMYLYMPAFGKERRIASGVKSQNFAGTDFSYDDLEAKTYESKYNAKLLKTEGNIHTLELTSKVAAQYSKVIITVNKTNFCTETSEYFDKGGNKIKEAKYTFKKVGNYWNPEEIEMTDLKKNHKTKMQMLNVKYDVGLKDDDFSVRKLLQ